MRIWRGIGLLTLAAAAGCMDGASAERTRGASGVRASAPEPPPPPRPFTATDSAAARTRIAARAASVRAAFARADALSAREVAELRQDVNAEQVASAREHGLQVSGPAGISRLVRRGRLVALGDSTAYWILRGMDHSAPYVTPETRAMLEELGRRFHARLDALGLPRYRMKVTSALRTAEDQQALRRINSYATTQTSAHQFATTVDVSHERFAVPAPSATPDDVPPDAARWLREAEDEALEAAEKEHGGALQAALGRAIADMRDQGLLHVMMENRQPVYHMTLASPLPRRSR